LRAVVQIREPGLLEAVDWLAGREPLLEFVEYDELRSGLREAWVLIEQILGTWN
jgi:hypothetical protein